ncbi:MAG TPA: hypothetical protein VLE96_06730 [Chlamydiales bacterium]|nr:hypothetical protein [Chlamydiales bacterium]
MVAKAKKRTKKQTSRKSVKKRAAKKVTSKKRTVKKTASRKTAQKRKSTRKESSLSNHESLWRAYKGLQEKIDDAWKKLQADVKRKAKTDVLTAHKNHLLLLLGECNYMARECMKSAGESESSGSSASTTPVDTDNNPFKHRQ